MTKQNFLQTIQEICKEKNCPGNQLLYDFCKDNSCFPWGEVDIFADKIWLIGRSYAASPERRYVRVNTSAGEKIKNRGNGTSEFFMETARYLLNDTSRQYKTLCDKLKGLASPYRFDGSESDRERLIQCVTAVDLYNKMVKAASEHYDSNNNKEQMANFRYRNMISYCSKFLHFHAPHGIFMLDSFAKAGAGLLYPSRAKNGEKAIYCSKREEILAYAENRKRDEKEIKAKLPSEVDRQAISEYIKHCLRSYWLGCFLHDQLDFLPDKTATSFPRITDSIFLELNKAVD